MEPLALPLGPGRGGRGDVKCLSCFGFGCTFNIFLGLVYFFRFRKCLASETGNILPSTMTSYKHIHSFCSSTIFMVLIIVNGTLWMLLIVMGVWRGFGDLSSMFFLGALIDCQFAWFFQCGAVRFQLFLTAR